MICFTEYDAPIGTLLMTGDENALTGLWFAEQGPDISSWPRQDDLPVFEAARQWLDSYFAGDPGPIRFPLSPAGTAFQQRIWKILLTIPYGETATYGAVAKLAGPESSPRAVGQAVGRNPIGIIIPCHRVVGAKGQLTGYAWGVDRKIWLLRHEEETK